MNRIEKLIAELCPDGVEWKKLGEVAIKISSGGTPKTGVHEYYENGNIPWLRTQEVNFCEIYDTEIKITELGLKNSSAKIIPPNCVIMAMYGATVGKVAINKIPLSTNQACANIQVNDKIANTRYIFYYLSKQYKYIKSLGTGSQTNINSKIVQDLNIPIPPLPIQEEIVKILDSFTELEAELESELEARKKQYEYYRNKLLTPVEKDGRWYLNGKEVEWKKLGEVCEVCSGGTPSKNKEEYWINGNIPWLKSEVCNNKSVKSSNSFINELGLKNSNAKLLRENTTLMALVGATIFKTAFLEFKASINQNIAAIKSIEENKLKDKFIFYCLTNMYKELKSKMNSYGMLNLSILRNIPIPLPPLSEQERIVAILDKFDALVNDISQGLPAEIEARRKQYEYYRNRLLTFEPKQ
jgi:type I restriction enzyme S subunit